MDPIIGAGLISAGASLLGNLFGAGSQSSANKQNLKIMREQQAWQEKMWNKQNEYNTPENQLSLYQDAGYNPLTALNAMSGNSSAGSVGTVQSAQMQAADFSGFGQAGQAIANAMMQKELIQSQIDLNNANAGKSKAETEWTKLKGEIEQQRLTIEQNMSEAQINQYNANISYIKSQKEYTDTLKDFTDSQIQRFDMLTPLVYLMTAEQINEIRAHCKLMIAQAGASNAQAAYYRKVIGWLDALNQSIVNLNNAQANNQNAQARYTSGAQTANTNANTGLTNSRTEGQNISNEINRDTKGFQKVQIGAQTVGTVITTVDQTYNLGTKFFADGITGGATAIFRNGINANVSNSNSTSNVVTRVIK